MQEHVVIGAGLAGAAAAWRLAARGEQVTVLERSHPANHEGSSHGSARIFRYAYPEQLYTDLVVRAKSGWDELQSQSGRQLISPTGALDHGQLRHPERLAAVLERAGVDHELLSPADASRRWPQFRFETPVLWHPAAGVLDAHGTVEAMLALAVATGNARVLTDWDVSRVEATVTGYRVRSCAGDVLEATRVIVAAGGWLPRLLSELSLPADFVGTFPPLEVRQEQAFHFPYAAAQPDGTAFPDWPTFIHKSAELQTYGLPGGRDAAFRGQKVAQFNGGRVIPSASEQDGRVSPDNRRVMIDYANRFLPGVDPVPYAETTCLFTNTPSEDFVIDRADGIIVVAACSGHGAKFAPLLGDLAADLATGAGEVPAEFRVAAHRRAFA